MSEFYLYHSLIPSLVVEVILNVRLVLTFLNLLTPVLLASIDSCFLSDCRRDNTLVDRRVVPSLISFNS